MRDQDVFLTEREAADLLRVSRDTLRRWRCDGRGPRCLKLEGCIRYGRADLLDFVERSVVQQRQMERPAVPA